MVANENLSDGIKRRRSKKIVVCHHCERSKIENVDPLSVVRSRFVYLVDVVGRRSYVLHTLFE